VALTAPGRFVVAWVRPVRDVLRHHTARPEVSWLNTYRTDVSRHTGLMSPVIADCGSMLGGVERQAGHHRHRGRGPHPGRGRRRVRDCSLSGSTWWRGAQDTDCASRVAVPPSRRDARSIDTAVSSAVTRMRDHEAFRLVAQRHGLLSKTNLTFEPQACRESNDYPVTGSGRGRPVGP
jgi:hypothetical protein